MPAYNYKRAAELGWALLTAVGIVLAQAMVTLEPEKITDWRAWAIGLGGAMVRAGGAALMAWFGGAIAGRGGFTQ